MIYLEYPLTPNTRKIIACMNNNIKTHSSQKFNLVTGVVKSEVLQFKIDIFCVRSKDKCLLKSLTKPYQYVGCLQVCFKIYRYRRTTFEESSFSDRDLNPPLPVSSQCLFE